MLLRTLEAGGLDDEASADDGAALARLAAEAEQSSGQVRELLQLSCELAGRVRDVPGGFATLSQDSDYSFDENQLTAQVTYLEKKIGRMREKVRQKSQEASRSAELHTAGSADLLGELLRLRAERDRLQEGDKLKLGWKEVPQKCSPGSAGHQGHQENSVTAKKMRLALKRHLNALNAQMRELSADRIAADSAADAAQGVAAKVETLLKEVTLARETERIRLEAEREVLRRRIEEQEAKVLEMEAATSGYDAKVTETLLEEAAEIQRQVVVLTRHRDDRLAHAPGFGATSATPALSRQRTPGSECRDASAMTLVIEPVPQQSEIDELVAERAVSEQELERVSKELDETNEQHSVALRDLEQEHLRVRTELQRAENKCRRVLSSSSQRRKGELEMEAEAQRDAVQASRATCMQAAAKDLQELRAKLQSEFESEKSHALARSGHLESQLANLKKEVLRFQDEHKLTIKRQDNLRGRFYLALRDVRAYKRSEVLHYLSSSLELTWDQLDVVEESFVPQGIQSRQLARIPGALSIVSKDTVDTCVRPLRSPVLDHAIDDGEEESEASADISVTDKFSVKVNESLDGVLPASPDQEQAAFGMDANEAAGYMMRLTVEVNLDGPRGEHSPHRRRSNADKAAAVVRRLVEMVAQGSSLLEDIGVVGVSSLRGSAAFGPSQTALWQADRVECLGRAERTVAGRPLVLTCLRQMDPCMVKLLAVDTDRKQEFALCLDQSDLQALLGENSALLRQSELAPQFVDVLVETLHITMAADENPVLVAVSATMAPQTVLNMLSSETRNASPTAHEADAAKAQEDVSMEQPLNGLVFQEVLLLGDAFFTLIVHDDADGCRVRLEEPGSCRAFEVALPGAGAARDARQLRACAQALEFETAHLLLSLEEIPLPAALVVRVARGDPMKPLSYTDPDQRVFWISRLRPGDDCGICQLAARAPGAAGSGVVTVTAVPATHRARLLGSVRKALRSGISSLAPDAIATTAWRTQYGHKNMREGVVLRPPRALGSSAAALAVETRLLEAAGGSSGRVLLKVGRRLSVAIRRTEPMQGRNSGFLYDSERSRITALCVMCVREISEPYLHFTVSAHEVGSCRSWTFLVNSLDIFRALGLGARVADPDSARRSELASRLAHGCHLLADSDSQESLADAALVLDMGLVGDDGQAILDEVPMSRVNSRKSYGGNSRRGTVNDTGERTTLAPQLLSQDEAANYGSDPRRFCLLHAPRKLGTGMWPAVVDIYAEPDAPGAAFMVHNLLLVVQARGVYFSLRLDDTQINQSLRAEEGRLLEPEHRQSLLERVFGSLDICTSTSAATGALTDRVAMQPFLTTHVPMFAPNEAGTLCPLDGDIHASRWLDDFEADSPPISRMPSQMFTASLSDGEESAVVPALPGPSEAMLGAQIGSFVMEPEDLEVLETGRRALLASRVAPFGDAFLELLLYHNIDADTHGLVIKQLNTAEEFTGMAVEMAVPISREPSRLYLEYRSFDGEPMILGLYQQSFPSVTLAVIFDPKTYEELDIVASSSNVAPLMERSLLERLSELLDHLTVTGSGCSMPMQLKNVNAGREVFPSDLKERGLQRTTPVIVANFEKLAHEVPSDQVTSRELIFSCTRYIISPDALTGEDADLDGVPTVRLSLTKKSYCQDFTFCIEYQRGDVVGAYMLHIRDKLSARPLGLYGEIQKVGELRFLLCFLDDAAPRALRICVSEPTTKWTFSMIVLDEGQPLEVPSLIDDRWEDMTPAAYLAASSARFELLQLYRRRFSSSSSGRWAERTGDTSPGAGQGKVAPAVQKLTSMTQGKDTLLIRETRFTEDDDLVVVSVGYEFTDDGALTLRLTASQPELGKEKSLLLADSFLDALLFKCGLPKSTVPEELKGHFSSIEESHSWLFQAPQRTVLTKNLMHIVEVVMPLDIVVHMQRLEGDSSCSLLQTPRSRGSMSMSRRTTVVSAHQGTVSGRMQSPAPARVILECREENLLGRTERQYHAMGSNDRLRCEVFDCSNCVQGLFHRTNLRVRLEDLSSGRKRVVDLHEEELEPWLARASLEHLLNLSWEPELVKLVLGHATLDLTVAPPDVHLGEILEEDAKTYAP